MSVHFQRFSRFHRLSVRVHRSAEGANPLQKIRISMHHIDLAWGETWRAASPLVKRTWPFKSFGLRGWKRWHHRTIGQGRCGIAAEGASHSCWPCPARCYAAARALLAESPRTGRHLVPEGRAQARYPPHNRPRKLHLHLERPVLTLVLKTRNRYRLRRRLRQPRPQLPAFQDFVAAGLQPLPSKAWNLLPMIH